MADHFELARRQAMALRSEFVRAFAEHVGPRPASELMKVRLPALLTIAALTALGALVVGVFLQLIADRDHERQAESSKVGYSAVAGWGCQGTHDHGFEAHGRTAKWLTVPSGGWGKNGCQGTYETIPMSGKKNADDPGQFAEFWFRPRMHAGQCDVKVFLPAGTDENPLASDAHYVVLGGDGAKHAEFVIDQNDRRGDWVPGGAFPVKEGKLAIRITNRGVPEKPGARIAVTQIKVECSR